MLMKRGEQPTIRIVRPSDRYGGMTVMTWPCGRVIACLGVGEEVEKKIVKLFERG